MRKDVRVDEVLRVFRENGYEALFHGHPDGIYVFTPDGRLIEANESLSTLTGYSKGELGSMSFDPLVDDAYRELTFGMFQRAVAGETVRYVTKGSAKDGHDFYFDVTNIPLRDEQGTVVGVFGIVRDVTDVQRAVASVDSNEAMIKAAGRIARFAGWSIDVPAMTLHWSDELHEILGLSEAAPYFDRSLLERFADETYRNEMGVHLERCINDGVPFDIVAKVRDNQGVVLDARILAEAVRDPAGRIVRVEGAFYDVTWLARQREEMARLEGRVSSILDEVETPLLFVDRQWQITFANRAARALVEASEAELVSTTIWSALPEWVGGLFEDLCELAMHQGVAGSSVLYLEQRRRYFEVSAMPSPEGIVVSARDVTVEHEAAKQLDEASQRTRELASMLDLARDAIIVRDFKEGITFWNKSAEELYGWTFEEVKGLDTSDVLFADFGDSVAPREAVLEKGFWVGEMEHRTKDGRRLIIDCTLQLIYDENGVPKGLFGVNTDVTALKHERERSIRAQRVESIGTLAGGIAHDLNNVLAPVLMSIELLARDEEDERRRNLLTSMEASVKRGAEMIRQVLSFARGVEGAQETISLVALLDEVHQFCRDTLPKQIVVAFEYENDLHAVEGDATQLMQVLINLVTNARDAMPYGGRLMVRAHNQPFAFADEKGVPTGASGPGVVLEVSDTGEGMDQEVVSRIFDPFYTTKAFGSGTGLGLSTSLAIVKGHHGRIDVDSRRRQGTKFRVSLPAVEDIEETPIDIAEPTTPVLRSGGGRRILVVDDEAPILMMLDEVLRHEGFIVDVAQNGDAALQTIEQSETPYDLIITDLNMPQLSGEQLAAKARGRDATVRFIFMSGVYASPTLDETMGDEALFIQKPFSTAELLELINAALA